MEIRRPVLDQLIERLRRLGLRKCPVCSSESLQVDTRPALLSMGSADQGRDDAADPVAHLRVVCGACGNVMLFDIDTHWEGDEPIYER